MIKHLNAWVWQKYRHIQVFSARFSKKKNILNVNERLVNYYVHQWNGQQVNITMKFNILIVFISSDNPNDRRQYSRNAHIAQPKHNCKINHTADYLRHWQTNTETQKIQYKWTSRNNKRQKFTPHHKRCASSLQLVYVVLWLTIVAAITICNGNLYEANDSWFFL